MGRLDNQVAIVTGAGGGIGRCHALALAAEGCRVVVNDLGGTRDGSGSTATMAESVVAEIVAGGGDAIANADSVTDIAGCDRMVADALARWGRVDIVDNNAGILRDRTFAKMTPADWDIVIDVHLSGTRNLCRAALDALKVRGGAIVNTTSYSGLIGNFGQSNYAAAKAGIYGLTRVLALELKKAGVAVNCVAPVAKTRMTDDIGMIDEAWLPAQISPIVVFLATEAGRKMTGQVFGVQGQRIHLYEMKTNDGVEKAGTDLWTVDELVEAMPRITAWASTAPPPAAAEGEKDIVTDVFSHFPAGFKKGAVPGWKACFHWVVSGATSQTLTVDESGATAQAGLHGSPTCTVTVDRDTLVSMFKGELEPTKAFMTVKAKADAMGDLMKMAMAFDFGLVAKAYEGGSKPAAAAAPVAEAPVAAASPAPPPVGKRYDGGFWLVNRKEAAAYAAATDDMNPVYAEGAAPPMYHVKPFFPLMMKLATDPALGLDLLRLVHGEHEMRFHRVLRHGEVLQLRGSLQSVEEKASGTVVRYGLLGFVDGAVATEGTTTYFVRAAKKVDAPKAPAAPEEPPPPPSWVVDQSVTLDQATRYAAASGDDNPIHLDEATARQAGLPGVILHGLCTMALAQRDLVARACGGDPGRLAFIGVRFARPVLPGTTLQMQVWDRGNGRLDFMTLGPDGKPVITGGRAEIRG